MKTHKFLLYVGAILSIIALLHTAADIWRSDIVLSDLIAAPFFFFIWGIIFFISKYTDLEKEIITIEKSSIEEKDELKILISDIYLEKEELKFKNQELQRQIEILEEDLEKEFIISSSLEDELMELRRKL